MHHDPIHSLAQPPRSVLVPPRVRNASCAPVFRRSPRGTLPSHRGLVPALSARPPSGSDRRVRRCDVYTSRVEEQGAPGEQAAGTVVGRHFGTPASHVRSIAVVEGLSYLVLLFIAMPLKYLADMPLAVRIAGSAHGALFVWLGLLVLGGLTRRGRSLVWAGKIFVASLLPFGTFVIDRGLRDEIESDRRLATNDQVADAG